MTQRVKMNALSQFAPTNGTAYLRYIGFDGVAPHWFEDLAREFAPYIGVSWTHFLADTGRLKKQAGEPINDVQGVAGVRFWF